MDRIDLLESKVRETIATVQQLRDENQALKTQIAEWEEKANALSGERSMLDNERSEVRDRIEQLLGDLENVTLENNPPEARQMADDSSNASPEADAAATGEGPDSLEAGASQAEDARLPENRVLPGLG
ncbi:MAG: cell division protein ZapB [Leptospirillia bacterium]